MVFAEYCFLIALAADIGAVGLIVAEALRMSRLLRRWRLANPARNAGGGYPQLMMLDEVMQALFEARVRAGATVALVVIGIAAGTLGNFASL